MDHLGQIGFSEMQAQLLSVATSFCRQKSSTDHARRLLTDEAGYDDALWEEMIELGWLAIAIPEEYGGAGLSLGEVVPVMEQIGCRFLASPFFSTTLAAQAILAGGSEHQKQTLLPRILAGEVATVALTEDTNDWDLSNIRATAFDVGDELRLTGKKRLVVDGAMARWIVVSVMNAGAVVLAFIDTSTFSKETLRREITID